MTWDGRDMGALTWWQICTSFPKKIFTPAWWWVGWWRCGRTSVAAQSCAGSLLRHTMLAHPLSLTFQVGQVVAVVLLLVPITLCSSLEVKPFSCFWHFGLPASNQIQALSRKSWSSNKESLVDNVNIWNIVSVILWRIFFLCYDALPLNLCCGDIFHQCKIKQQCKPSLCWY